MTVNTVGLWLLSKQNIALLMEQPYLAASQVLALVGVLFLSLTLILSARLNFLEDIFGGLDKDYILHHVLGSLGFVLIVNHPLLLVVQSLPLYSIVLQYLLPIGELSIVLGVVAVYLCLFSFICMVFIKLPYHIWIITHDLLALAFLLGSIHALMIPSDISNSWFLRIWMLFFMMAGIAAAGYIIFLFHRLGPRYKYRIVGSEINNDIIHISFEALEEKIKFKPGQFVYIKIKNKRVKNELHPFSPSNSSQEGSLRISAKIVGDYTKTLSNSQLNDIAYIYGPYGRFGEIYEKATSPMVWIGGGIGVTPFISMMHEEAIRKTNLPIQFYYTARTAKDLTFLPEINAVLPMTPSIEFFVWDSESQGRLSAEKIEVNFKQPKINYNILICGPPPMMESLCDQFQKIGIDQDNIIFEKFNLL